MAVTDFEDKVIYIRRTAKTYKGGRRFRFGAMVVMGDRNGRVGVGLGKAKEVPIAVQKGQNIARRNMIEVPIEEPGTVPHEVLGEHGTSKVMLKPAGAGTGVIAGSVPRAIVELAGFKNLRTNLHLPRRLCLLLCPNRRNVVARIYFLKQPSKPNQKF